MLGKQYDKQHNTHSTHSTHGSHMHLLCIRLDLVMLNIVALRNMSVDCHVENNLKKAKPQNVATA